jgi:murein endopeptidase
MHACLLQINNHVSLLLIYCNLSSKVGHDHVRAMLLKQRPIFRHAYIMHSAISCFHVLELPNDIQTADR